MFTRFYEVLQERSFRAGPGTRLSLSTLEIVVPFGSELLLSLLFHATLSKLSPLPALSAWDLSVESKRGISDSSSSLSPKANIESLGATPSLIAAIALGSTDRMRGPKIDHTIHLVGKIASFAFLIRPDS